MSDIAHIGVVGGGAWGTALACLARRAGRKVSLWSRDPAISRAIAGQRRNPVYLPDFTLDEGIEAVLGDPFADMLDKNLAIAKANYDLSLLPGRLATLLASVGIL